MVVNAFGQLHESTFSTRIIDRIHVILSTLHAEEFLSLSLIAPHPSCSFQVSYADWRYNVVAADMSPLLRPHYIESPYQGILYMASSKLNMIMYRFTKHSSFLHQCPHLNTLFTLIYDGSQYKIFCINMLLDNNACVNFWKESTVVPGI